MDLFIVFGIKKEFRKEILALMDLEPKIEKLGDKLWKCRELSELIPDQPISEVTFVITDIETTGPDFINDRIIDLAAVKVLGGEIIGSFEQLINPEQKTPKIIERLTGINPEMLQGKPLIEYTLRSYFEFLGQGIFVAHNSSFDFSFIDSEAIRIGIGRIRKNMELCTLKIAKKLLPNQRACGLNGLSKHYEYAIKRRHRAMSDVKATKFFLDKFIEQLAQNEIVTLHQLLDFQRVKLEKNSFKRLIDRKKNNHGKKRFIS